MNQSPSISILSRGRGPASAFKFFLQHRIFKRSPGPFAVEKNLTDGLRVINTNFNLNPPPTHLNNNLVILRDKKAADWVFSLHRKFEKVIVGPNFSAEQMAGLHKKYQKLINFFIAPSPQVQFVYKYYGVPETKIKVWPVGINTEDFGDTSQLPKTHDALVYFKRRTKAELAQVLELLKQENQSYQVLEYGRYDKNDFRQATQACRYAVILDGTESQGIALEEIMASNLPLFVFDQVYLGQPVHKYLNDNLKVTSIPYWSDICGVVVPTDTYGQTQHPYSSIPETREKFKEFLTKLASFNPRSYILENLSLVGQAKKFLEILG